MLFVYCDVLEFVFDSMADKFISQQKAAIL